MSNRKKVNKLLSKIRYMYYQTELDGSEVNFVDFIEGLKSGGSFRGIVHTERELEGSSSDKVMKEDGYLLIDEGETKLAILINSNVYRGKNALERIEDPDRIRYTRISNKKADEILEKGDEAGVTV
ncbi:hypothetical protein [Methanonatronarchaeum sp. AMET6-2]|uniref:hypothetical protein n=1 Tax=Methanonatronarchaeum sp. AMET6-2 TaxID=2933293 RepID=UPI0011F51E83|nr:hypothetical protein [Methanonatronarchaeum sp. AMET6-2]RZN60301.1 MAG: hypothetical protein EF811_06780 [Methanonatronarchaeia archaeon]UOY10546.1 hypothetical protein MU439_02605 [Methanonatronarchaeum sp. AMET6-2]